VEDPFESLSACRVGHIISSKDGTFAACDNRVSSRAPYDVGCHSLGVEPLETIVCGFLRSSNRSKCRDECRVTASVGICNGPQKTSDAEESLPGRTGGSRRRSSHLHQHGRTRHAQSYARSRRPHCACLRDEIVCSYCRSGARTNEVGIAAGVTVERKGQPKQECRLLK
jgi:hypothetical protein